MARRPAKYARNSSDAARRQEARNRSRRTSQLSAEDSQTVRSRSRRIRDVGQEPPKGYLRQMGSRYFVKEKYVRPIRSMTTPEQRAMYYANQHSFHTNSKGKGFFQSVSRQGQWGADGNMNFRKTTSARKLIDSNGGTYPRGYGTAGGGTRKASRYNMAFGQDGHKR